MALPDPSAPFQSPFSISILFHGARLRRSREMVGRPHLDQGHSRSVLLGFSDPIELFVPFLFIFLNEPLCIRLGQAVFDKKTVAIFILAPHRPDGFEDFGSETFKPMILVHFVFASGVWLPVGAGPP